MFSDSKHKISSPFSNLNTTAFSLSTAQNESPNVIRNLDIEMDSVDIYHGVNSK
jgi:hypothetical protein